MSRAIFVSDIHISSATDPKAGLFLRFLNACLRAKVTDLFLVGDIFDLWIADRSYFTHEYNEIIVKIRQLITMGMRVYYFEGNHDLDLKKFWQQDVGCEVHAQAAFFTLDGLRVRIEHGDQMDPEDRGYLFLRWLLRTRLMVFLGRYLPNFIVEEIGHRASESSRQYTTTTKAVSDNQVREKIRNHAIRVYDRRPFDIFISGHVHVAEDSLASMGAHKFRCINLGTWLKKPILLEIHDGSVELRAVEEILSE